MNWRVVSCCVRVWLKLCVSSGLCCVGVVIVISCLMVSGLWLRVLLCLCVCVCLNVVVSFGCDLVCVVCVVVISSFF